jgi:hypothetical protein
VIYEIQTLHRVYDIEAYDRQQAFAVHYERHPGEAVIDSKDKTAKRAHETRTQTGSDG